MVSANGRRTLLLRYAKNGEWARPGGAIEPLELAVQAAVREISEEVGIDLAPYLRDGALIHVDWQEGAACSPPIPWVAAGYFVQLSEADEAACRCCEPDKHDQLRWWEVTPLIELTSDGAAELKMNPLTLGTLRAVVDRSLIRHSSP